jgi:hypothetical protein
MQTLTPGMCLVTALFLRAIGRYVALSLRGIECSDFAIDPGKSGSFTPSH